MEPLLIGHGSTLGYKFVSKGRGDGHVSLNIMQILIILLKIEKIIFDSFDRACL
jgi:hypothetical protein